jgi:S1-C subfamily serine protease
VVQPGVGGGTGFAVKAPSGTSYLMTNDHVCEISKDKLHMMVIDDEGKYIPRTILHRSDKSDLCLLEGMPGVDGLEVAEYSPSVGDILVAVGHPSGYLTTMTKGELIMRQDIKIPDGVISVKEADGTVRLIPPEDGGILEEDCKKPKNEIVEIERQFFFGPPYKLRICVNVTRGAYITNVAGQPGSSGSAVVNDDGQVIAVLFAGDRFGWSILVSLDDVKDFLSKY